MVPALQVVNIELQTLRTIRSGLTAFHPADDGLQTSVNQYGDRLSVVVTQNVRGSWWCSEIPAKCIKVAGDL